MQRPRFPGAAADGVRWARPASPRWERGILSYIVMERRREIGIRWRLAPTVDPSCGWSSGRLTLTGSGSPRHRGVVPRQPSWPLLFNVKPNDPRRRRAYRPHRTRRVACVISPAAPHESIKAGSAAAGLGNGWLRAALVERDRPAPMACDRRRVRNHAQPPSCAGQRYGSAASRTIRR